MKKKIITLLLCCSLFFIVNAKENNNTYVYRPLEQCNMIFQLSQHDNTNFNVAIRKKPAIIQESYRYCQDYTTESGYKQSLSCVFQEDLKRNTINIYFNPHLETGAGHIIDLNLTSSTVKRINDKINVITKVEKNDITKAIPKKIATPININLDNVQDTNIKSRTINLTASTEYEKRSIYCSWEWKNPYFKEPPKPIRYCKWEQKEETLQSYHYGPSKLKKSRVKAFRWLRDTVVSPKRHTLFHTYGVRNIHADIDNVPEPHHGNTSQFQRGRHKGNKWVEAKLYYQVCKQDGYCRCN